jgi:hypothetical protein
MKDVVNFQFGHDIETFTFIKEPQIMADASNGVVHEICFRDPPGFFVPFKDVCIYFGGPIVEVQHQFQSNSFHLIMF